MRLDILNSRPCLYCRAPTMAEDGVCPECTRKLSELEDRLPELFPPMALEGLNLLISKAEKYLGREARKNEKDR